MSYHRVLPPPPALASQIQPRAVHWLPKQDTLRQNSIMADSKSNTDDNMDMVQDRTTPSPPDDRPSPHAPSDASGEAIATSPNLRVVNHQTSVSPPSLMTAPHGPPQAPSVSANPTPRFPDLETYSRPYVMSYRPPTDMDFAAFILYRQHHQARVVAQNPGLANPEISKVIGDHWRQSPPDVKQHWKNLAEV
ncbi:MAG: hypothetical protein Q9224_002479 [Gallowayella concinna]